MKTQSTYPLRLPRSVKAEVETAGERGRDQSSISSSRRAVAEKLAVMNSAAFFAERRNRADFKAFDRIMRRKGGSRRRRTIRYRDS